MTEQLRQSLSALMDDEATDFEVRQILKQASESTAVSEQYRRYSTAQAAMHDQADWASIDISGAVAEAIDNEAAISRSWGWMKPAGGFAVAASVAAVVVFATQGLHGVGPEQRPAQLAELAPLTASPLPALTDRQNARTVAETNLASNDETDRAASQALLQQRLSQYMQIHAKHASMNGSQGALPLARVTNYRVER